MQMELNIQISYISRMLTIYKVDAVVWHWVNWVTNSVTHLHQISALVAISPASQQNKSILSNYISVEATPGLCRTQDDNEWAAEHQCTPFLELREATIS